MHRKQFEETFINSGSLVNMTKDEALRLLGKEVAMMIGYNQNNPHHCYDLWEHSIKTMQGLTCDKDNQLRVAAFFHDIGKPSVARVKDGRTVYYGHAQKSVEIANSLLNRLGYMSHEIEQILFYIEHHDDFISWVLPQEEYNHKNKYLIEITKDNLKIHIKKTELKEHFALKEENWCSLFDLCKADVKAQSDEVWQNGKLIDTKVHKLAKIELLAETLHRLIE